MNRICSLFPLMVIALALNACAASDLLDPRVTINTPTNASQFQIGQDAMVQSTSEDFLGVTRVELLVDEQLVKTDVSPDDQPQKSFNVLQTWKATRAGPHAVVVRATNARGQTGEAAILITVANATVNATATPQPTLAPTRASSAPAATKTIAPATVTPTTVAKRTLTFTEAQIGALINSGLAAAGQNSFTVSSVSLQNGQITIKGAVKGPLGMTLNGTVVVAVSANNCDLKVIVTQAQVGGYAMTDAQKNALSQQIDKALSSAVAQSRDNRCVESVKIANGVLTVVYY